MLRFCDVFLALLFCFILFLKNHRIVHAIFSSREGRNTLLPVLVCDPSQGTLKAWDGLPASWLTLCTMET